MAGEKLFNFINGERRNPASGEFLPGVHGIDDVGVPASDLMDVVACVQATNQAIGAWQKLEANARASILLAAADGIRNHADELARLEGVSNGQPISQARAVTLPQAEAAFRYHAQNLLESAAQTEALVPGRVREQRLVGGLTALLLPWSEATLQFSRKVAPALASGCAVIVKPSHLASRSVLRLAEILCEAGVPRGIVNVVCGRGRGIGADLISHPGISHVSFTGSTQTGREVLRQTAEGFKKLQMSMGGRNPVLVFGDVDLEIAASTAVRLCLPFHTGMPYRGSRLFVQETIYRPFLEAFKVASERLVIGSAVDERSQIGPMPSVDRQEKFISACEQARKENGKPLFESSPVVRDLVVRPQVFFDLTLCSTLQQEEVVGPFVTVASFKYQHEAIKHANNSPFGQAAYVLTKDFEKAAKVAAKIEAGSIAVCDFTSGEQAQIGDFGMMSPAGPATGLKQSSYGEDGAHALLDFYSRKTRAFMTSR